ncbi:MAG TPA: FmdB family zinc ribbon protein [Actinomycetota bacterium]|nr:FmdB family zinc ribbon protein [Actinomycetota bacterium]
MPTYEYACTECGNRVEVFQRLDEDPMTVCERCGGTLRKIFHPAGIVFKGSGFYATDSRTKSKSGSSGGDGDGKSGDAGAKKKEESKASPVPEKPA